MADRVDPTPPDISRIVRTDAPLWRLTSLRVGGPARFLARPKTPDAVRSLLQWAHEARLETAILAGGTNTISPDRGYPGLVVHAGALRGVRIDGCRIIAAAGERLSAIVEAACEAGLSGLEWAAGIPGTVGGALAMNAGAADGDMSKISCEAVVQSADRSAIVPVDRLELGYRTSAVLTGRLPGVITEVRLELRPGRRDACLRRVQERLRERAARLPDGASAGCIFRNPPQGPTAGELLDRAGCKGMRVGRARVSERHANIVVNEGRENASDVLRLMRRMRQRVRDRFGFDLEEEVVIMGRRGDAPSPPSAVDCAPPRER